MRLLLPLLLVLTAACSTESAPEEYVARVGDRYLTQSELDTSLQGMGAGIDTSEARKQIIEQWVTRTLLLNEALRLNLAEEPDVQRRLEDVRRSVLVTELTNRLYEQAELAPSPDAVASYYQRHREQLRLREPYVRVRHLRTQSPEDAQAAREALSEAGTATADSLWPALVRQYGDRPEEAQSLSDRFLPESRLFATLPYVRDELAELGDGDVAPVIEDDGAHHVVQVVRRVPAGTVPEQAWVEDEIRRRLTVRSRKQMYAREVQRLRNEARAQNRLDVR